MKKVGDLMAELGFREEGSDGVKRAFIENLVRSAGGNIARDASRPAASTRETSTSALRATPSGSKREVQLSFDFADASATEPETPFPLSHKRPTG